MDPKTWSIRQIIIGTVIVAAIFGLLAFLIEFNQVVFSIFLALTLSVAVEPMVDWLQKRGYRRLVSAMLVYTALLLLAVVVLVSIIPLLYSQVSTLGTKIPEYYEAIRQYLLTARPSLVRVLAGQLPINLEDFLSQFMLGEYDAWSILVRLSSIIFNTLVVLLLSFYWTLDSERATRFFILNLSETRREGARELIGTFKEKVGAYIRGQTLLCLVVGAMSVTAYLLIGMPYAFSLGLVAGIFEAVPMVGPIIGMVPALILAMAISPDKIFWVILSGLIIQQLENNLLVPRVMDRSVGVSPVVTILAIAAFSLIFGIPGALLAVPVAAVLQVVLDRFIFSNPNLLATAEFSPQASPVPIASANGVVGMTASATASGSNGMPAPAARDRLSVLSLELHELTQDIRKQQRNKDALADTMTDEIEDDLEVTAERLYEIISKHVSEQAAPRSDQVVTE